MNLYTSLVSESLVLDVLVGDDFAYSTYLKYYLFGSDSLQIYSYTPHTELIYSVKSDAYTGEVYVSSGNYSYDEEDHALKTDNGFMGYSINENVYAFVYSSDKEDEDIKIVLNGSNVDNMKEYITNFITVESSYEDVIFPNLFDEVQDIYASSGIYIADANDIDFMSLACISVDSMYFTQTQSTAFDESNYEDSCLYNDYSIGIIEESEGYALDVFFKDKAVVQIRCASAKSSEEMLEILFDNFTE
ncbi:MAG: hypothetical protein LUE12_06435 [Ruminococcus sp.]|nr:hypothetical protein [Ruminococcus sp.]